VPAGTGPGGGSGSARAGSGSDPRDLTRAAVGCALMAVSAWTTVPVGPVPFTLQTMAASFLVCVLSGRQALLTMVVYVVIGALGMPVFSGMRGGIGVLFGPTGGFILALIPAVLLAKAIMGAGGEERADAKSLALQAIACAALVAVMYALGWLWLMVSMDLSPAAAFAAGCAPFILPDCVKVAAGIALARAVVAVAPSIVRWNPEG